MSASSVVILELDADVPGDRLSGKACISCGTREERLGYIGWARIATNDSDHHLSCPVYACASCHDDS